MRPFRPLPFSRQDVRKGLRASSSEFTPEQLEFLVRKKKFSETGEYELPESSQCEVREKFDRIQ